MKLILSILLFISLQSQAQIIRANAFYRPPVSGCSYLLDQYSGAAAAYSLRKVRCAYSGSLIRVRRSSDNTESDIGATSNGDLDTAALKAFIGTGGSDDGAIVVWYDQSGNSRDMTQSTQANQPLIMDNGLILRTSGYVNIACDGTNDRLVGSYTLSQPFTIIGSGTIPATSSSFREMFSSTSPEVVVVYESPLTQKSFIYANSILGDNTTRSGNCLFYAIYNSTSSSFYHNGSSIASGNAGSASLTNIKFGTNVLNSTFYNVKYNELIIYNSDKSTDRTDITNNINSYWGRY